MVPRYLELNICNLVSHEIKDSEREDIFRKKD